MLAKVLLCLMLYLKYSNSLSVNKNVQSGPVNYRLPTIVTPNLYEVHIKVDDDSFKTNIFQGEVAIYLSTNQSVNEIKLHTKGIIITKGQLFVDKNTAIHISNNTFKADSVTNIMTIKLTEDLLVGKEYVLNFSYNGSLNENEMYGFYKSYYLDESGKERFIATTQLQPFHARQVFPCFDEPSFKATFDVTLSYPSRFTAIGNTPIFENSTSNGITKTHFEKTPKMSTYLIAFVISEFVCTPGRSVGLIPVRVCSKNESRTSNVLATDLAPQLLEQLENFTGIKYSDSLVGKLDLVAIPDFSAGAMENWGLVTFRESRLLFDVEESPYIEIQRIATVIAHELAHMWFGDLVTTHWWSDTFLNEGFATYFEYHTTAKVLPDFELEKQFVLEELHVALLADAVNSSKALSFEVSSPSDIDSRFDVISYNKGGSIFRMVEHVMGIDKFKSAIHTYLNTYKFQNVTPNDLWDTLNEKSLDLLPNQRSLRDVMQNWTIQAGYPLLTVTEIGNEIIISQERFLFSGSNDTKWFVPISYTTSDDSEQFMNTSAKIWLTPLDKNIKINVTGKDFDWIILNNQQTGYYRVNYDDKLWDKISLGLNKSNFDNIHELNRAQIVDDLFNLARAEIHQYSKILNWIKFLKKDLAYGSWYAAFKGFAHILERITDNDIRTALSNHILDLMQNLYVNVTSSETLTDPIHIQKKLLALDWGCKLGVNECVSTFSAAFQTYKNTNIKINASLRSIIYCTALRTGDKSDWNFLWNEYNKTKSATEKTVILSSLGCTKDKTILKSYLAKSISKKSGIRKQDAHLVLSSVYRGNPEGIDVALEFLETNLKDISTYYKGMNAVSSLIRGLVNKFTREDQIKRLDDLITNQNLDESLKSTVVEALKNAQINLKLTKSLEKQLTDYFDLDKNVANFVQMGKLTFAMIVTFSIFSQFIL